MDSKFFFNLGRREGIIGKNSIEFVCVCVKTVLFVGEMVQNYPKHFIVLSYSFCQGNSLAESLHARLLSCSQLLPLAAGRHAG